MTFGHWRVTAVRDLFIDEGAVDRLVQTGMDKDVAAFLVNNVNQLIATGVSRDLAIRAVTHKPGIPEQVAGALVAGLMQGVAPVIPGSNKIWPGLSSVTASDVAPDLPGPLANLLGLGASFAGFGIGPLRAVGGTSTALRAIPGVASTVDRLAAAIQRIPRIGQLLHTTGGMAGQGMIYGLISSIANDYDILRDIAAKQGPEAAARWLASRVAENGASWARFGLGMAIAPPISTLLRRILPRQKTAQAAPVMPQK